MFSGGASGQQVLLPLVTISRVRRTCYAIAKNPKVLENAQFPIGARLGAPGDVRTCRMRKILTLPEMCAFPPA